MAAVTICAVILEPQKKKSDTVSTVSPSISHEMMGPYQGLKGIFHNEKESIYREYVTILNLSTN